MPLFEYIRCWALLTFPHYTRNSHYELLLEKRKVDREIGVNFNIVFFFSNSEAVLFILAELCNKEHTTMATALSIGLL